MSRSTNSSPTQAVLENHDLWLKALKNLRAGPDAAAEEASSPARQQKQVKSNSGSNRPCSKWTRKTRIRAVSRCGV